MKKYVAYYRVSSIQQGNSKLGLKAQKSSVLKYLDGNNPVKEFMDIESGTKKGNNRTGVNQAIEFCKTNNVILVIAKLDRLSRSLTFISQLMDSEIEFIACDMPTANRFTIHIYSALAEQEARFISERTKEALAELKKQGKKLGSPQNLTKEAQQKGLEVIKQKARTNENNRKASILISNLRDKGLSFYKIAKKLNEYGYKTRKGFNFSDVQAKRLYIRFSDALVG